MHDTMFNVFARSTKRNALPSDYPSLSHFFLPLASCNQNIRPCSENKAEGRAKNRRRGKLASRSVEIKRSNMKGGVGRGGRKSHVELFTGWRIFRSPQRGIGKREREKNRGELVPIVAKSTSKYLRRNLVTPAASGKARKSTRRRC